jgi:hypothetical protein
MRSWPIEQDEAQLTGFKTSLAEIGYRHPRIKFLPSLKIGQEALRDHGYSEHDYLTESMIAGYDESQLMCSGDRIHQNLGVSRQPPLASSSRLCPPGIRSRPSCHRDGFRRVTG